MSALMRCHQQTNKNIQYLIKYKNGHNVGLINTHSIISFSLKLVIFSSVCISHTTYLSQDS